MYSLNCCDLFAVRCKITTDKYTSLQTRPHLLSHHASVTFAAERALASAQAGNISRTDKPGVVIVSPKVRAVPKDLVEVMR